MQNVEAMKKDIQDLAEGMEYARSQFNVVCFAFDNDSRIRSGRDNVVKGYCNLLGYVASLFDDLQSGISAFGNKLRDGDYSM